MLSLGILRSTLTWCSDVTACEHTKLKHNLQTACVLPVAGYLVASGSVVTAVRWNKASNGESNGKHKNWSTIRGVGGGAMLFGSILYSLNNYQLRTVPQVSNGQEHGQRHGNCDAKKD